MIELKDSVIARLLRLCGRKFAPKTPEEPKKILNIEQQIQSFSDSGMSVASEAEAREALTSIGYFRLRGYCFPFYNNSTKTYLPGTSFSKIINIVCDFFHANSVNTVSDNQSYTVPIE